MVSSSFLCIILRSVSLRENGDQHYIFSDLSVKEGRQKGDLEKTKLQALISQN